MPDGAQSSRKLAGDLAQLPVVWRYELLKYLRSKRLLAAIAIVVSVLALMYLLPPALGNPYSGTDTGKELYVVGIAESGIQVPGLQLPEQVGFINRSVVLTDTLVLYLDGEPLPSADGANWTFTQLVVDNLRSNIILFAFDVSGHEVTATYEWRISAQEFNGLFLNFASILVVIAATFFAADSLVSEFQNRTGYLIFPNPIRRETILLGKFAASLTAGVMVMALFYVGIAGLSFVTAKGVDDDFLLSFAFAVEFVLSAMAVAYVISAGLKGSTGALVLTFFLFLMILPIVDGVSAVSGVKVEGSVTFASGAMTYILYDPYPVDSSQEIPGMGFTIYNFYPDPGTAAIVMMAYAVAGLAISTVLFKRRQLAG